MLPPAERIAQLEQRMEELQRRIAEVPCRAAQPRAKRDGWWIGTLLTDLIPGGLAEVQIEAWDRAEFTSRGKSVKARDYAQNGEIILAGATVEVAWYGNTWVVRRASNESNIVQVNVKDDTGEIEHGSLVNPDQISINGVRVHSGLVCRFAPTVQLGTSYPQHAPGISMSVDTIIEDHEACYILFVDQWGVRGGNVPAHQGYWYGPARLLGYATVGTGSSAKSLPLYAVKRGLDEETVMVTLHPSNGSGTLQTGAIDKHRFLGYTITDHVRNSDGAIVQDRLCMIEFVDFAIDTNAANLQIIAEYGRIYGPAKYVGEADLSSYGFGTAPIYRTCVGEQEFQGKSASGQSKGGTATFTLYDEAGNPTTIEVQAVCLYNKYRANKYARIHRSLTGTVANQVEC
jgi:hypothetical protein